MHDGAPAPNDDRMTRRPHPATPRHSVPATQPASQPHSSKKPRTDIYFGTKYRASVTDPSPSPNLPRHRHRPCKKKNHQCPSCKGPPYSQLPPRHNNPGDRSRKSCSCLRMARDLSCAPPPPLAGFDTRKKIKANLPKNQPLSDSHRSASLRRCCRRGYATPPALARVREMAGSGVVDVSHCACLGPSSEPVIPLSSFFLIQWLLSPSVRPPWWCFETKLPAAGKASLSPSRSLSSLPACRFPI